MTILIERAKKLLFRYDNLTPFEICEIIQKLQNMGFMDWQECKEFILREIQEIIERDEKND